MILGLRQIKINRLKIAFQNNYSLIFSKFLKCKSKNYATAYCYRLLYCNKRIIIIIIKKRNISKLFIWKQKKIEIFYFFESCNTGKLPIKFAFNENSKVQCWLSQLLLFLIYLVYFLCLLKSEIGVVKLFKPI